MAGPRKDVIGIEAFARLLKRLRTTASLTQRALEEKSGVAENQISRYENRKEMASSEVRERLAKGLDLTFADLEILFGRERASVARERETGDKYDHRASRTQAEEISEQPRPLGEPLERTRAFVRTMLEHEHEPEALISEDVINLAAESILSLIDSLKLACDPGRRRSS